MCNEPACGGNELENQEGPYVTSRNDMSEAIKTKRPIFKVVKLIVN